MRLGVTVIDYGAGNLRSMAKALEASGAAVEVTGDPARIAAAERVVLPGVGAFGHCVGALNARPGVREAIEDAVISRRQPFLGVCVGMQLMADAGHEHGSHAGLGWIGGEVVPLEPGPGFKVPHMGWNRVAETTAGGSPVLGMVNGGDAYFVHGYRFAAADPGHVLATTENGEPIAAAVGRDNLLGVQFHPEKSQAFGLALLARFLAWKP